MAVGDKIQLAFKSEVTAVNTNVTTLNTTVNDPTTGLVTRVTNLEAGGGAGMTPQQVTDLAACVTDKHTHANKTILDLITAEYTTAEKTKLANITDNFKGLYADAAARLAGVPVPLVGNYVLQEDTNTVWYYNGASWLNTGVTSAGDMLKSVYDPNNKIADAFSMGNMVETTDKKVLTGDERTKLDYYRGIAANGAVMNAYPSPLLGNFCIRHDTNSVWIYDVGGWVNSAGGAPSIGDTKFSYKTVDHDGWYILNGRNVSTLSISAQTAAATLGWATIVPNTQGRYTIAASPTITSGTTGGSSFIGQSSLPNITLNGTTGINSVGHSHTTAAYNITETTSGEYATDSTNTNVIAFSGARTIVSDNGDALGANGGDINSYMCLDGADRPMSNSNTLHTHPITINVPSTTSGLQSANHTHTFTTSSINGGVTQIAHLPTYSAKTEFVFLGL